MIYIVQGSTGEYSDRTDWPVRAFHSEERAKELVLALEEWCRLQGVHESEEGHIKLDYYERDKLVNPLDPNFRCDYTGTRYYYYPVPLDDEALPS